MATLLIIDDEPQSRETLHAMVSECFPDIWNIREADGVKTGLTAIHNYQPEVVLLDIQMNDGTGFDLLDHLPTQTFSLVFTTAHDEFAVKAFRYHAVDYLLKPIDYEQLEEALHKVQEKNSPLLSSQLSALLDSIKVKRLEKLALPSHEGITYIRLDEIAYLQSEGNYTTFFLKERSKVMVVKPMQDYDEILPKDQFFRIHQSYMVQASEVRRFLKEESEVILLSGDRLPVARRRRQEFLDWLNHT